MIRLSLYAMTIWISLILFSSPQAAPQPMLVISPPDGITLHLTQSGILVDRNGVVFAKTRANSTIGDIVWKVDAEGKSVIVLQPGPDQAYGNGYLDVLQGQCVLVTANKSNQIVVWPIPECVAP